MREIEQKLGIGARGLVVHDHRKEDGHQYSYFPDNSNVSWRSYGVKSLESLEAGIYTAQVDGVVKSRAPVAVFMRGQSLGSVAQSQSVQKSEDKQSRAFLINLDAFLGLEERQTVAGDEKGGGVGTGNSEVPQADKGSDLFLIYEKGKYHAVYGNQLKEMNRLDKGEAKVLVRRGAVAAAIPPNKLPYGTHCALINLMQLVPGK